MGKYNNKDIGAMVGFAISEEKRYETETDKCAHGTPDYYYFHGKAEAYHDMVHYLVEMKNSL